MMNKYDKVKAIRFLNDAGAMLITKSGDKICQVLRHQQVHPILLSGYRQPVIFPSKSGRCARFIYFNFPSASHEVGGGLAYLQLGITYYIPPARHHHYRA